MHRKLNSLVLTFCLLCTMALPTFASEIADDRYINVLDYCTANESGYNSFSSGNSKSVIVTYAIPFKPFVRYVDILVRLAGGPLNSALCQNESLNILEVDSRLYRVYGNITLSDQPLELKFESNTTYVNYTIMGFNCSTYTTNYFRDQGQIVYNGSGWITMGSPTTSATAYNPDQNSTVTSSLGGIIQVAPLTSGWKKYDYMDFEIEIRAQSINSVSCTLDNVSLPVELSYINKDGILTAWTYDENDMFISGNQRVKVFVRVDFSQASRLISTLPTIRIDTTYDTSYSAYATLSRVTGFVETKVPTNVAYSLLQIKSAITNLTDTIVNQFTGLYNKVAVKFDEVVSAINGNTAPGQQFTEEIQNKVDDLNEGNTILSGLDKPDLGTTLGNISLSEGNNGILLVKSTFGVLNNNAYLSVIFTLCLILGVVSYLLYGGKD